MRPETIQMVLPQRPPMLMVDDILELRCKEWALGYKKIKASEVWVQGHFPGDPVFPGALVIEHMAQVSLFLRIEDEEDIKESAGWKPYLAKVEQVKFLKPIRPDMELYTYVKMLSEEIGFVKVQAEVFTDRERTRKAAVGKIVCYLGEE